MAMTLEQFNSKYGTTDSKSGAFALPDVKKTTAGEFAFGLGKGIEGFGVNAALGLATPFSETARQKLNTYQDNTQKKMIEKLGYDGAQSYATKAGMGLGQSAGQLALSAINPVLGYTAITGQAVASGTDAYNTAYETALAQGKTKQEAKKIASINGIVTGAVNVADVIPVSKSLKLAKSFATGGTGVAKRFASNALTEAGTEGLQDFTSALTARLTYDGTRDPVREGIESTLVSLPSTILFGGVGEANTQLQIRKATTNISDTLQKQGMEKEKADNAADLMVKQTMMQGEGDIFEQYPQELENMYKNATEYKQAQIDEMATNPEYKIDTQTNDMADHIISIYNNYQEKNPNNQDENAITFDTDEVANEVLDTIPDDNFVEAEKEWTDTTSKEYAKLQKQIIKEQKKLKLAKAKEQFLNEPYKQDSELPVIEFGNKPKDKSGLPVIQTQVKPTNITGYTYEPIVEKIDKLLEKQDTLITNFQKKHTEPKKKVVVKETKKPTVVVKEVVKETPKEVKVVKETVTSTKPSESDTSKSKTTGLKSTGESGEFKERTVASKLINSIQDKLIKGEELTQYETQNLKQEEEKSKQFVNDNPKEAREIAMGEMDAPEGYNAAIIHTAYRDMVERNGDVDAILELGNSPFADQATAAGQFIKGLDTFREKYSPTKIISQINKDRKKSFEKQNKNVTIKEENKKTIETLENQVKKDKPKKNDWEAFINKIQC